MKLRLPEKFLTRTEYLLGLAGLILALLYVYLNMSLELHDPDIWLHLKAGEYIVTHRLVPDADIFSCSAAGRPWLNHSWLLQTIYYAAYACAGADRLLLLSAAAMAGAFLALFFSLYRRRQELALSVALLFLAALATKLRFNVRPENFSLLFFAIYLLVLSRAVSSRWVFFLPVIQLFWVNFHGFFILGPLCAGVFLLADKTGRKNQNLLIAFILCLAACFFNPYGWRGALYPLGVLAAATGDSAVFYRQIQELLPAWHYFRQAGAYYALAGLSALLIIFNFRRVGRAWLILWLAGLALSLRVNRNIAYFNFIAALTVSDILGAKKDIPGKSRAAKLAKYLTLALVIFWMGRENLRLLDSRYYLFEQNRYKSALLGRKTGANPEGAAGLILAHQLKGNLFNLFNYGSYLAWRLYPQNKVFIDGRTEVYGGDFFKEYRRITGGDRQALDSSLEKYDINIALLKGNAFDIAPLADHFLKDDKNWALVYFSPDSLVFLKKTAQNAALADNLGVDLKKWATPEADLKKIGMKNAVPVPYLKRAWLFCELGQDQQALNEARQALNVMPSSFNAYNVIGRVYLRRNDPARAFKAIRLARAYGPRDKETLINLGDFYLKSGEIDKALKQYRRLTRLYPAYARGHYLLGEAFLKAGKPKEARRQFLRAAKLDPFEPRYPKMLSQPALPAPERRERGEAISKKGIASSFDKTSGRSPERSRRASPPSAPGDDEAR